MQTIFHLDEFRKLAWGKPKKKSLIRYSSSNEDTRGAARNRQILWMIDEGKYEVNIIPKKKPNGKGSAKRRR